MSDARVHRIHHTAIVVADVDASLRFWRDGLGFQLLMDDTFRAGRGRASSSSYSSSEPTCRPASSFCRCSSATSTRRWPNWVTTPKSCGASRSSPRTGPYRW
ncbi:MAG: VOC family protein [Actinobacteria bacterium]|nr:MAG: VOC family protein [Actinomycetota bacterium]